MKESWQRSYSKSNQLILELKRPLLKIRILKGSLQQHQVMLEPSLLAMILETLTSQVVY